MDFDHLKVGKTDPIERGLRPLITTSACGPSWKNRPDRKGIKTT